MTGKGKCCGGGGARGKRTAALQTKVEGNKQDCCGVKVQKRGKNMFKKVGRTRKGRGKSKVPASKKGPPGRGGAKRTGAKEKSCSGLRGKTLGGKQAIFRWH